MNNNAKPLHTHTHSLTLSAELAALAASPDHAIDVTDIPSSTPADWADAQRGKFYRPIKQQLTLRIDADVIDWFKQQGRGYQSRINTALRAAMPKQAQ
jgi:uncharacterized protein (DUF4415 family)